MIVTREIPDKITENVERTDGTIKLSQLCELHQLPLVAWIQLDQVNYFLQQGTSEETQFTAIGS